MVHEGLISIWGCRWGRLLHLSATSSGDTDTYDDDDPWTPLNNWDYLHLGVTGTYQLLVLVVVLHLWVCRKWPPYIPRQISLVCITGIAGVVAYCGALIAYGAIERKEGDFLANCGVEGLFDYTGWGVWMSVALVRVYRSWKIFCRHSVDMWTPSGQVALLSLPWLVPAVAYSIDPELSEFNERGNWCDINVPIDTALYVYTCVPILGALCLSFQMRRVRKQMNFYRMQVSQLFFLLLMGTLMFPFLVGWLERWDDIRRTYVMYDNVVSSLVLFWPPIAEPLYRFLIGDAEYLNTYTKGFSVLPTPAQDQLSLQELRQEFAKFADSKVARELPDFYNACLNREETTDFFERQAVTTAIIDRFIRVGAEQEVKISGDIRNKILETDSTRYNIFNDAMTAVLEVMQRNFREELLRTEACLERAMEEAEELERHRQMNQLPPKEQVEEKTTGLLKLISRVSEWVGIRSSSKKRDRAESRGTAWSQSSNSKTRDVLERELDDFVDDGTLRRRSERRRRPPRLDLEEGKSEVSKGSKDNDNNHDERDDQRKTQAPFDGNVGAVATTAASAAAASAESEELRRRQYRTRLASAEPAPIAAGRGGEAAEGTKGAAEAGMRAVKSAAAAGSSVAPYSFQARNTERTSGMASRSGSRGRASSTRPISMPISKAARAATSAAPSSSVFAVGNPRAVPPPSLSDPCAGYSSPSFLSRPRSLPVQLQPAGGTLATASGSRGAAVGEAGAGVGLPSSHVSPPLTLRSSEDSSSVSWCSDNYTNTHGSSESSSISGRGYAGGAGSIAGRLLRRTSSSSSGIILRSGSSHLTSARPGSGGGDGAHEASAGSGTVGGNSACHDYNIAAAAASSYSSARVASGGP